MPKSNEQMETLLTDERMTITDKEVAFLYGEGPEHQACGTTECCGGCEEKQVDLADATLEQTKEAAIDLMVSILGLQQSIWQHIEVLNMVSMQMDDLGVEDTDVAAMSLEALRRFGIPEENIAAVFAEMETAWAGDTVGPAPTVLN